MIIVEASVPWKEVQDKELNTPTSTGIDLDIKKFSRDTNEAEYSQAPTLPDEGEIDNNLIIKKIEIYTF